MITEATTAATDLAATVAMSVATTLASSEPLTASEPSHDRGLLGGCPHAVLVAFTGEITGEFALVVDGELTGAIADSELGALDLAQVLRPTVQAAGTAIGSVVLGTAQLLAADDALARVLDHPDAAVVALRGAASVRAGIAIGLDAPRTTATPEPELSNHRLDLLRGVQMEATAELGRARMTINDLLSLRNGAVIELDRPAGGPADLFVNGRLIARGEVVVIDENFGLRITQVVTAETGR